MMDRFWPQPHDGGSSLSTRAVRRTSGKLPYEAVEADVQYPDRSVPRLLGDLKLDGRLGLQPVTLPLSMSSSPWLIATNSGRFKSPASALSTWMSQVNALCSGASQTFHESGEPDTHRWSLIDMTAPRPFTPGQESAGP